MPISKNGAARRGFNQKPRQRSFRYSENSKPASRAPKDDRTLNRKGPQVEILRPKWKGSVPTTIRAFPMFCPEEPNGPFDPTRLTCDEYEFSDWTRGLPAAKYVGIDQKYTFLTHDPRRVRDDGYNPRKENPYHILYNAIMDAVKEGEAMVGGRNVITAKWAPLTVDGPKKSFQAPTKLYFLQGFIYEHDKDTYIKGGQPPKGATEEEIPIIIEVSKTAGESLGKKANELNPAYKGDTSPEFQSEMYAYGDIVDLTQGSFITFFNPDVHDVEEGAMPGEGSGDDEAIGEEQETASSRNDDGDNRNFKGWDVAINSEFYYTSKRKTYKKSADISKYEDIIRQKLLWWDDVLYIPEHDEIALWLAQAFRSMPDLLRFGWLDNPEFFTDEVNGVLSNRTQGLVPGDDDDEENEDEVVEAPSRRQASSVTLEEEDEVEDELEEDEVSDTVAGADLDEAAAVDDGEYEDEEEFEEGDVAAEDDAEADDFEDVDDVTAEELAALDKAARAAEERAAARALKTVSPPTKKKVTKASRKQTPKKAVSK